MYLHELMLCKGHGHAALYLDRTKVTQYIALEPNKRMHDHIRTTAHSMGFTESDESLLILSCGAQETAHIPTVDTIISIMVMCSIPDPQHTMGCLVQDVLKPGGVLLFYEHVLSPRADVAWWQALWSRTYIWGLAFDGCKLDRPTHLMVEGIGGWRETDVWGVDGEDEENILCHRLGRFVRE
jgi:SAM-dependent methyltransferase